MIKPINDYIVLKTDDTRKKIKDIILVSDNDKKKSNVATVVAIPLFKDKNVDIKIGDKIIYRDYAVTEYLENEQKYLLIQLEDVLGIIY